TPSRRTEPPCRTAKLDVQLFQLPCQGITARFAISHRLRLPPLPERPSHPGRHSTTTCPTSAKASRLPPGEGPGVRAKLDLPLFPLPCPGITARFALSRRPFPERPSHPGRHSTTTCPTSAKASRLPAGEGPGVRADRVRVL